MRAEDATKLRLPLVAAFVAATALLPSRAGAFCRTTTMKAPVDFDATVSGCFDGGGVALYHPLQCLSYRLTKESSNIPNAVLSDTFARAFAAWSATNPSCTPGITAIELAPSPDPLVVGYVSGEPARNLVGVRVTDWPYGDATLGLSTLTFKNDTGEILDVDVEINGTVSYSFEETPSLDAFDLQSVVTHEAGHMLGLAHSDVVEAAMYSSYELGSIEPRTLKADDQAAICTVYPNRSQRLASTGLVPSAPCSLAPGDPGGSCSDPQILHGCSTVPGEHEGTTGVGAAGLVFALGATVIRRRRVVGA